MRCPQCGLDGIRDQAQACPGCRTPLRQAKAPTSEGVLEKHSRGTPMGRIRPATLDEGQSRDAFYRADAVLALTGALPPDLSAFEAHVASLIDGVRPVARLRKKVGVATSDLRIALTGLADKKLLRLSGIVEEALGALAVEIQRDKAERAVSSEHESTLDDPTIPGGKNAEIIPAHVMAEIQSMLDEDDLGVDDDDEV